MTLRISALLLCFTLSSLALAQATIESAESVAASEHGIPFVPDANGTGMLPAASLLDSIFECNRAAASIISIEGTDHLRVFGFQYISDEEYALAGPRAFSTATPRAQTRAMGSATEALFGVASYTTRQLTDSESTSNTATSVGAGENRERLSSLSLTTQSTFRQVFETESSGFLRGGRASGTKFVSLGGVNGYCVVVRYDIPLDQSGPAIGAQDGAAGNQTNPDQSGGPAGDDRYAPLPPGEAGDF